MIGDRLKKPAVLTALCLCALASTGLRPTAEGGAGSSTGLDLRGYRLTFDEEFDKLDVSARGPGTRWVAHTPWNGDFGDAQFVDPSPGFPFTIDAGVLRIEAKRDAKGKWRSGLLAATDPTGNGFSRQHGYYEVRAKLPPGPGVWPAFWIGGNTGKLASSEIDVVEYYGRSPSSYESVVHLWPKNASVQPFSEKRVNRVAPVSLSADFHSYGVLLDPNWTTFYFDRKEVSRIAAPSELRQPITTILVDLALGAGWPVENTPNPSYMYVDYIRVYTK